MPNTACQSCHPLYLLVNLIRPSLHLSLVLFPLDLFDIKLNKLNVLNDLTQSFNIFFTVAGIGLDGRPDYFGRLFVKCLYFDFDKIL